MIAARHTWSMFAMLVAAACCVLPANLYAAESDAAPAAAEAVPAPAEKPPANLAQEQAKLAEKFKDLERVLLRMAEVTQASDPKRAAVLRQVFAQSKEKQVGLQFEDIVKLLENEQLYQANQGQAAVQQDLTRLLELLLTGDRDKQIPNERAEIKKFIDRINRLIRDEQGLQGRTEGAGDPLELAKQQENIAEKTRELEAELKKFDERNAPAGESGDPAEPSAEGESPEGEGKPSDQEAKGEGKSGEKSEKGEAEKSDAEKGEEAKDDEAKDDEKTDAEKSDAEKTDPMKSDAEKGKPDEKSLNEEGRPTKGQPSEGKPSEGKSSKQSQQQQQQQQQQEGQPSDSDSESSDSQQQQQQQQNEESQARKRIREAQERMRDARRQLEEAKRRGAAEDQQKAIDALQQAKAELEEILRQLREEEIERTLAMLEGRFRKMLQMQIEVYEGTVRLDRVPEDQRDRDIEIESAKLGRREAEITAEADRALNLLREEGSSAAFPEAVDQMREDMVMVTGRLARANVGQLTQGIEQDVITALEEMIAALQKAQKEAQERRQGGGGGGGGGGGDQALVDQIAELKMIRALQMRVNLRTARFTRMLEEGVEQAEEPELLEAVRQLSDREQRIYKTTRDIVVGRNK